MKERKVGERREKRNGDRSRDEDRKRGGWMNRLNRQIYRLDGWTDEYISWINS